MIDVIKALGKYAKNPYVLLAMLLILGYCFSRAISFVDDLIEGYVEAGRNEIRVECQAAALEAHEGYAATLEQLRGEAQADTLEAEAGAASRLEEQQATISTLIGRLDDARSAGKASSCSDLGLEFVRMRRLSQCAINAAYTSASGVPVAGCS